MKQVLGVLAAIPVAMPVTSAPLSGTFASIDGRTLAIEDWLGQPVLVVNTASRCGFTKQYSALQTLYETYQGQGLVVLAVPSNDFKQELASAEEVKDFCELHFGLTIPMTVITKILGQDAHPFYQDLKEAGFVPRWNFEKVQIGPDGSLVATWGSTTPPTSFKITSSIKALLD